MDGYGGVDTGPVNRFSVEGVDHLEGAFTMLTFRTYRSALEFVEESHWECVQAI